MRTMEDTQRIVVRTMEDTQRIVITYTFILINYPHQIGQSIGRLWCRYRSFMASVSASLGITADIIQYKQHQPH